MSHDPYYDILTGGAPEQPQAYPNHMRSAESDYPPDGYRAILEGNAPPKPTHLPPEVTQEAAYLMQRMITLLQNTNFTAAQPAYNEPHFWSQPVDLSTRYSLPAAAGAYQTAIAFDVPAGRAVRIDGYGWDVQDGSFTYNGDILLQITKNGSPVPGLQDIAQQRGTLVLPAKTFIIGTDVNNDRFEVQLKRATAAGSPTDVDVCLKGWSWRPLRELSGPGIGIPQ
jgi:hypothetical protein